MGKSEDISGRWRLPTEGRRKKEGGDSVALSGSREGRGDGGTMVKDDDLQR